MSGLLGDWLAAQPTIGVAYLRDDPRPRKGQPLAFAFAGEDGRTVAIDGVDAIGAARALLVGTGTPLVGHEVKSLEDFTVALRDCAPGDVVEVEFLHAGTRVKARAKLERRE